MTDSKLSRVDVLAMGPGVGGGGGGTPPHTIPRAGSKSKLSVPRRKSLSLDKSPLERLRTTERRGSFAASTSHAGAASATPDKPERRGSIVHRWFRHISEAAEAYKTRDGKNRGRPEPPPSSQPLAPPTTDIDSADTPSQDKTKDGEESSSESRANGTSDPGTPASCSGTDLDSSLASTATNDASASSDSSTLQSSPSAGLLDATDAVHKKLERLRRKDEAIRLALMEKQQLVADILHVPREEFETIAELAGEPNIDKDASELVLAAVNQVNQLTSVLNDTLLVTVEAAMSATSEVVSSNSPRAGQKLSRLPGVPTYKLQSISDALNMQLTELLKIIKHRDEEREQLRRELQKHREQIHSMHETRHKNHLTAGSTSPARSRPNSCVSVGSAHSLHDSEDDTGLQRLPLANERTDGELVISPPAVTDSDVHQDLTTADEFVDALTSVEPQSQVEGPTSTTESENFVECLSVVTSEPVSEGDTVVVEPLPAGGHQETAAVAAAVAEPLDEPA